MLRTKLRTASLVALFAFLSFSVLLPYVFADDSYKPYLHEPKVPEHPKVKLYGSYSTSLFPGTATYTYPIEVPIGTNGLQPSLSLTYNSQSAKQRPGIVGAGWSVTQNYIYRDANATLGNTNDDAFKLIFNGASYDLVYDTSDGLYHTKVESFLKIQNLTGGLNSYGMYWMVTSKDGAQFRLGYSLDSELASNTGRGYALRWSLDQVNDTHGNNIYYSYLEDPNTEDRGTSYLSQILYNNDRQRKVNFVYEDSPRLDGRAVYDQGNQLNESRRLNRIEIYANNNLVRRYSFEYTYLTSENSLSSISKIKLYGSDNSSMLHQVSFDYYSQVSSFSQSTQQWITPVIFASDSADYGLRAVDLNNDGFVDLVQGRQSTSEKKAWLNNRVNNWTSSSDWVLPVWITDGSDADNGVRFVDFNNDGLVDILQATSTGSVKKAWASNGTGWTESSAWAPPIYFVDSSNDFGVQLADIDGDGRIDILQSYSSSGTPTKKAYLNNGTGWTDASSVWITPTSFITDNSDTGARLLDVNGDGLPDIIEGSDKGTVIERAWLNNGTGWVSSVAWAPPDVFTTGTRPDNGARFDDWNGDGLVDIIVDYSNFSTTDRGAWVNTGNGWVLDNTWQSPEAFTKDGRNIGRRLADVNGDGFSDVIVAYTNATSTYYWTWTKNVPRPLALKNITNEMGGVTSVVYATSTQFNNTGGDSLSDLGFNVWVVGGVNENNSLSGAFSTVAGYSYSYSGGRYDYNGQEFRGFALVNETRPDNATVVHYFQQDDARKGMENRTEIYNSSGNIFAKTENVYNYTNSSGYFKVILTSQASYLYDGSASNPNVTNVSYSYDNYGNILQRTLWGAVNVSGDEKYEAYSYVYNVSAWIVNKLAQYVLTGSDNSKVRDVRYSYDGNAYGVSPTRGDATDVDTWLNPYTGGREVVKYEYDSYGNLVKQTDPLGRATSYSYGVRDTSFTYPDWTTNALFHRDDYKYDLGTGNLLWEFSNNINHTFYYDVFGRIVKEVQPYDSFELPTKSYNYSFDGSAPESIKVSQRTSANKTYDVYYFYDGFANLVQLKKPADGGQQVVKNLFYDGLWRINSEQNPYFGISSTSLSTPTIVNTTNYTYDALGRINLVLNPDGTNKTVNFNHRIITAYDENGHRKAYVLDSYDRIVNVLEYNNDPVLNWNFEVDTYNTSYSYDTSDNLVKITDALGNIFSFSYDSLGRRISLSDPDLGNWTYTYDLAGNLISQKQVGGGNLVMGDGYYREYDELNQLIRIRNGSTATSPILENYTYDPFGQRIKISRNDSANTTIYTPFKELMQIRNSSGIYNYTYVYQDGVLVARVNSDSTKYFYHPDNLGSTSLITDASGNVVENTFYSPYGELLGGGTSDVKLYTGQFADQTSQYYYGARYYKPGTVQFVQPDKIIQMIYNPQSLNRYSYVWNNPYKYKDSTGNYIESFIDVAFILWDIYDIAIDSDNPTNYVALSADVVGLATPAFTGGRIIVKGGEAGIKAFSKSEKVADIGRTAGKVSDTKNMDKISDATKASKSIPQAGQTAPKVPSQTSLDQGNKRLTESPSALGRTKIELDNGWKLQVRIDFGRVTQPVEIQLDLLKPQNFLKNINLHQLAQDIFGELRHIKIPGLK